MFRKHLAWLLLLQLVFVLGGCGGGSDSVPPSHVSVRSVDVLQEGTIEPKSVTAMSVTLSSDADFADLAVAYYLVSGDEEAGEPELF